MPFQSTFIRYLFLFITFTNAFCWHLFSFSFVCCDLEIANAVMMIIIIIFIVFKPHFWSSFTTFDLAKTFASMHLHHYPFQYRSRTQPFPMVVCVLDVRSAPCAMCTIRSFDQRSQIINFIVAISATSDSETGFLLCAQYAQRISNAHTHFYTARTHTHVQFSVNAKFSKWNESKWERKKRQIAKTKTENMYFGYWDAKRNAQWVSALFSLDKLRFESRVCDMFCECKCEWVIVCIVSVTKEKPPAS